MYRKIAFIVIWYFVAAFTPSFAATDLPYTIEVAGISKVYRLHLACPGEIMAQRLAF